MSTEYPPIVEDSELKDRLDQLIPPPLTLERKLVVGTVLLALTVAFTILNIGGYLLPKPFGGLSFGSGGHLTVDRARGLVATPVMIPNNSQRTVRVVAVTLDAPGAELVDVELAIETEGEVIELGDVRVSVGTSTYKTTLALPAPIGAGQHAFLILWFRPLDCEDSAPPWGIVSATFDFGDDAFPPFARTVLVDQDPIWEGEEPFSARIGDQFLDGTGPLAVACEALR